MPKISAYTDGTPIQNADQFIVVRSGQNRRVAGMLNPLLGNYKLVSSVASNNLTLALKDLAGSDFSSASPFLAKILDTQVSISGALSVTKNAGTNWANAGSAELATKEIDYFAYLINETGASAGVKLGWSRIPYGTVVGDFSSTTTNEKYLAGPTNYNATDKVQNIGRFNATLSAAAAYTWSLPATQVIMNQPMFETRVLTWSPQWTNLTVGNATVTQDYVLRGVYVDFIHNIVMGNTSSVAGAAEFTLPFSSVPTTFMHMIGLAGFRDFGTDQIAGQVFLSDVNKARPFALTTADADTYARQRQISNTVPFVWAGANNDQLMTSGRYKIA